MTPAQDEKLLDQYSRLQPLAGKGPHLALFYGLDVAAVEWLDDAILQCADDRCRAVFPPEDIEEARVELAPRGNERVLVYDRLADAIADQPEVSVAVIQSTPEGIDRLFGALWPLLRSGGVVVCNHYRTTRRHKRWECCFAIDAFLETLPAYSFSWMWKDVQCAIKKT